jgi:hypothetical protein
MLLNLYDHINLRHKHQQRVNNDEDEDIVNEASGEVFDWPRALKLYLSVQICPL